MSITLDDIRNATAAKYGSYDIDLPQGTLRLRNPLRLTKAERQSLKDTQSSVPSEGSDEDFDQEAYLAGFITLVAEDKDLAKFLLAEVGDDLGMLATIMRAYTDQAKLGEA